MEPLPLSDVKGIVKKVLDGTYDDKKEIDWLNKIKYQNLPRYEKADFRNKYLKHIPLYVLEDRELQRKQQAEERARLEQLEEEKMHTKTMVVPQCT